MKPMDERPEDGALDEAFAPIVALAKRYATAEGATETILPSLALIRWHRPTLLRRGILQPSVCIVLQGRKKVHIGKEIIPYGAGGYLAAAINMPVAGQVVSATASRPYLCAAFALPPAEVAAVLADAQLRHRPASQSVSAAVVGQADDKVLEVVLRFLKALDNADDAAFLAPSLRRELIYRLLTGPSGPIFYQSVCFDRSALGIGRALEWLKDNYKQPLKIDALAKIGRMSVSSLHHKFKAVTTMGPLQYQKQLRLGEARRLLLGGLADATTAAYEVGYVSSSQFSREYRRLFGLPPVRDAKKLRSTGDRGEV
jgi:AraC-like DNA-binding protein